MKKLLVNSGFIVTVVYGVINLIALIDIQGIMSFIGETVLGVDVFTWHIFGIFSIFTLFIRLYFNSNKVDRGERENWIDIKTAIHIIFMFISFSGIYYLFKNCF